MGNTCVGIPFRTWWQRRTYERVTRQRQDFLNEQDERLRKEAHDNTRQLEVQQLVLHEAQNSLNSILDEHARAGYTTLPPAALDRAHWAQQHIFQTQQLIHRLSLKSKSLQQQLATVFGELTAGDAAQSQADQIKFLNQLNRIDKKYMSGEATKDRNAFIAAQQMKTNKARSLGPGAQALQQEMEEAVEVQQREVEQSLFAEHNADDSINALLAQRVAMLVEGLPQPAHCTLAPVLVEAKPPEQEPRMLVQL
jgi:hypothetical protein